MAYSHAWQQREYGRLHYQRNKKAYKASAIVNHRRTRENVRMVIADYLADKQCIDCGEGDPIVLEFDHRDPQTKRFNIGDAGSRGMSVCRVLAEIAKCDIRCANCHRRKTYRERASNATESRRTSDLNEEPTQLYLECLLP